jgi:AraC-like DNA-binding protein
MISETISEYSQYTSGIILLMFTFLQLIYRRKAAINMILAGLYFCLSYIILHLWLFQTGYSVHFRYLLHSDTAIAFAVGPLVWLYIRCITGKDIPRMPVIALLFVPAVLVLGGITAVNALNPGLVDFYRTSGVRYPVYDHHGFTGIAERIANVYVLVYMLISLREAYLLFRGGTSRDTREIKLLLVYLLLVFLFVALLVVGVFTCVTGLIIVSNNTLAALGVLYFVFSFRYPEFTQKAIREARTIQLEKTPVSVSDADAVIARMDILMANEGLFRDEELSLQRMSVLLGVTPHQLSRVINGKLNLNFRGYLNSYRIREAHKLLRENPEMSVLEIAFATGFNSKSSFNECFVRLSGMTPREFRNKKEGGG